MILINYSSEVDMEYHNTNNDILADTQVDILKKSPESLGRIVEYMEEYELSGGVERKENFSHDNWKGVAAWQMLFLNETKVPVFGRHSWNPVNFITFLWMQNKVTRLLLQPFISLRMIFNCIFTMKRDSAGRPHTSGRLLDYFLCKGFGLDKTLAIMTWTLGKFNDLKNWNNVFDVYFDLDTRYNYKVREAYYANR